LKEIDLAEDAITLDVRREDFQRGRKRRMRVSQWTVSSVSVISYQLLIHVLFSVFFVVCCQKLKDVFKSESRKLVYQKKNSVKKLERFSRECLEKELKICGLTDSHLSAH